MNDPVGVVTSDGSILADWQESQVVNFNLLLHVIGNGQARNREHLYNDVGSSTRVCEEFDVHKGSAVSIHHGAGGSINRVRRGLSGIRQF